MNKPNHSITGFVEIALRVHDLDMMRRFYEQVIGLEVLRENEHRDGIAIFYTVGAGNSHLALFSEKLIDWYTQDKSPQIDPKLTPLSHFALSIALDDFESAKKRIEQLGIEDRTFKYIKLVTLSDVLHFRSRRELDRVQQL